MSNDNPPPANGRAIWLVILDHPITKALVMAIIAYLTVLTNRKADVAAEKSAAAEIVSREAVVDTKRLVANVTDKKEDKQAVAEAVKELEDAKAATTEAK